MTARAAKLGDYLEVTKPRVVALIVFTAVVGMLLAVPALPPFDKFAFGTLGIWLAAASAAAINHLLDRQADAAMSRTRDRPLPAGHLTAREVAVFAAVLGVAAMFILGYFVNLLTAVLTLVSLVGYAVVYTLYLKRATPQNIVIGGAAGAAPPVLGWAAVTGEVSAGALLLFLIIFVWTPPHFWALAIHRRDDYARVNIPMLPVTHGVEFTGLQIVLYTLLLMAVSVLPYLIGMSGGLYLVGALSLGALFLYHAIRLKRRPEGSRPMQTFTFSLVYLAGLFTFLLFDHYLPLLPR
ncbi:MAG TPA: heme o synthase [Gammaproteobacteria bacterium]|nr:heme o synthase [Gammaproteobacteria bacterium]